MIELPPLEIRIPDAADPSACVYAVLAGSVRQGGNVSVSQPARDQLANVMTAAPVVRFAAIARASVAPSLNTGRRDEFVSAAMDSLLDRGLIPRVVLYSKDPENLRLAKRRAPELRIAAFDYEMPPLERLELMRSLNADGLVTGMEEVLAPNGTLTEFG